MFIVGSSPPSPPSSFSNSTLYCLLWQTGQLRSKRLRPMPLTSCRSCIISLPTPTLDPLQETSKGTSTGQTNEDMMTGDLVYPNPLYPTTNSAQQQLYPTQYHEPTTRFCYPIPHGTYPTPPPYLPPPPGLGFSPQPHYPWPMQCTPTHLPQLLSLPLPSQTNPAQDREARHKANTATRHRRKRRRAPLIPPSHALVSCARPSCIFIATTMTG